MGTFSEIAETILQIAARDDEITRLRADLAKVTWQRNEAQAGLAASQAECERLSSMIDHQRDEAIEMERMLRAELAASQAECENARHRRDHLVNALSGIYALLYPAPITTPDGQVMMFRPNGPDPHAVLQELSDRIRAIPATIDAAIAGEVKP